MLSVSLLALHQAMTGSACGPLLGGVLAQQLCYASLGWAALAVGLASALSFGCCARGRDASVRPRAWAEIGSEGSR